MRVCEKHIDRAVDTLVSKKDGTEYDVCQECLTNLQEILNGPERVSQLTRRTKSKVA